MDDVVAVVLVTGLTRSKANSKKCEEEVGHGDDCEHEVMKAHRSRAAARIHVVAVKHILASGQACRARGAVIVTREGLPFEDYIREKESSPLQGRDVAQPFEEERHVKGDVTSHDACINTNTHNSVIMMNALNIDTRKMVFLPKKEMTTLMMLTEKPM